MSRAMATRPSPSRRRFDHDFKAQAVRLVLDEGKSVGNLFDYGDQKCAALELWAREVDRIVRNEIKTAVVVPFVERGQIPFRDLDGRAAAVHQRR